MDCCTNSFPRQSSLAYLILLVAVLALPAYGQTRASAEPYQKIALKTAGPCTVAPNGELTSLVKNGVELSVNEDWDCDGVPDAYDNCVGMPNQDQADSNGNRIGDVCEAAVTIKTGVPDGRRLTTGYRPPTPHKPSRPSVRRRRSR